jgi:transcription antitermination factor NusG
VVSRVDFALRRGALRSVNFNDRSSERFSRNGTRLSATRKLSTVEAPFFPRYQFIVLDLARHQWHSVNGTIGVSRLVMCGDRPHPVPPGVVEAVIEAADARGVLQLGQAGPSPDGEAFRRANRNSRYAGRPRERPGPSSYSRPAGRSFN